MTLYQSLKDAGLLDSRWQLPLGADGGRDNFAKDAAVGLSLDWDREVWRAPANNFLEQTCIGTGLFMREPGNSSQNSVDNYIGTVVAASILVPHYDTRVLWRGHNYNWTFSLTKPSVAFRIWNYFTWYLASDWYGRFIGFPVFIRTVGGESVSIIRKAMWTLSVYWTCRTPASNTSNKILLWLMYQCLPHKGLVYQFWRRKMTHQYGDVGGMMSVYYGARHPFTVAAKGRSF